MFDENSRLLKKKFLSDEKYSRSEKKYSRSFEKKSHSYEKYSRLFETKSRSYEKYSRLFEKKSCLSVKHFRSDEKYSRSFEKKISFIREIFSFVRSLPTGCLMCALAFICLFIYFSDVFGSGQQHFGISNKIVLILMPDYLFTFHFESIFVLQIKGLAIFRE